MLARRKAFSCKFACQILARLLTLGSLGYDMLSNTVCGVKLGNISAFSQFCKSNSSFFVVDLFETVDFSHDRLRLSLIVVFTAL